ncbi:MAG: electron transfer flavoprotein subunit alpha/FixB family protein [Acidimicrobiales bacterium]|nr:electron transfer flavoprotein subunit alpha/FixB family protein [Acidimicrobiales bacterium]MYH74668.1 electron transfer flavoprotein subunit alpha/FixB family protein [Acidimicrobiales bacterium]MYK72871.1 electron transfer flavoprotein subunit alpha/FixB family protein [Acidimicrobiales bacterium]
MSGVAVLIDHDRGVPSGGALEALTAARSLAADLNAELDAVILGDGDLFDAHGADLVATCAAYGAAAVHCGRHSFLADYGPDAWGAALAMFVEAAGPVAVMAAGTDRGAEAMAQLAARRDLPLVANCVNVSPAGSLTDAPSDPAGGEAWRITRIQWGGSLLEDVTLTSTLPLLTIAQHSIEAEPCEGGSVHTTVADFKPDLGPEVQQTLVRDRVTLTEGITLSTAPVVVSGGRGVGSADGFAPLEELAELLGGRVGCSRAVTNNGWRSHADQVGQTGTRIAPEIYIACGISGAIQHWVGAMGSKNILAINIDPEANMVTKAGYAVIADLHEVVPAICDEIRRRRDRPPS